MRIKSTNIKMIGYGLAVLYAASLIVFLQTYRVSEFRIHTVLLTAFFVLLFAGAIAVTKIKEWGRLIMVFGNLLLGLYLLKLYINFHDLVSIVYILTVFIIFLFFTQQHIEMRFQANEQNRWQSVLVIDDDDVLIKTIRPFLISQGFAVLTANRGEDGLLIARNQRPDLILLDVILPGLKGRDVCRQLKEDKFTKDIPVVFLTAKDSPDDIQAERDVGGEDHLTKPVNIKEMIKTIRRILD